MKCHKQKSASGGIGTQEFTVRSSECLPLGHHVMKDVAQVANTILVLAVSLTEILSLKGT